MPIIDTYIFVNFCANTLIFPEMRIKLFELCDDITGQWSVCACPSNLFLRAQIDLFLNTSKCLFLNNTPINARRLIKQ